MTTTITDAAILARLAANNGAILHWQLPRAEAEAFRVALNRGVILWHGDADCYVHPRARGTGETGWTMPEGDAPEGTVRNATASASEVAEVFVRLLRQELGEQQMGLVRVRNRDESSRAGVCHSHDFCDANMVMDAALEELGMPYESSDDGQPEWRTDLWNAAWAIACEDALTCARGNVFEYFESKLGCWPEDGTLVDLPVDSPCGLKCVEMIQVGARLADLCDDCVHDDIHEVVERAVSVAWRG